MSDTPSGKKPTHRPLGAYRYRNNAKRIEGEPEPKTKHIDEGKSQRDYDDERRARWEALQERQALDDRLPNYHPSEDAHRRAEEIERELIAASHERDNPPGSPSRADLPSKPNNHDLTLDREQVDLAAKALEQRWPLTPKQKQAMVEQLHFDALNSTDPRHRHKAITAAIKAGELNAKLLELEVRAKEAKENAKAHEASPSVNILVQGDALNVVKDALKKKHNER